MKKFGVLLFSCLIFIGCQNDSSKAVLDLGNHTPKEDIAYAEDLELESPKTADPPELHLEIGSKIIKNGSMEFEVDDLQLAKIKADSILNTFNGYFESEQYSSYGNRVSYSLQIRVPNVKFDSLLLAIEKGIGQLKSKKVTAKDVTEEYVDLNIRLENNLAYVMQYKEILTKAQSVKEILEVQEKIRRIEEEIESKKGRLKYLNDRVKYSTLSLEISEKVEVQLARVPSIGGRFVLAFNNGGQFFMNFIIGLVNLWPFLLLLIVALLFRRPISNRIKKRSMQMGD